MRNPFDFGKRMARMRWNRVERGCAAAAEVAVIYPVYGLGMLYGLSRDDKARLIHADFVRDQLNIFALVSLGALLLWALGLWLRGRSPRGLWYQHLTANYFGLALVWVGYITGTLNLAAGVVLMGAAVTGYIVLDRRVIVPAFINALLVLLALTMASSMKVLPYAPAMVPPDDAGTRLFWLHTHLFVAAPHIVFCLVVTLLMLQQWRRSEGRLLRLGTTDGLTGLYNRRSILEMLQREGSRARENGEPLAVGLLDLDHFKRINDHLGHLVGDRVLRAVADALRDQLPDDGRVGRFGGEEFLVVLPGADAPEARAWMQNLRRAIQNLSLEDDDGQALPVTVSAGLACDAGGNRPEADALVSMADDALYQAKHHGRNKVVVLKPDSASAAAPVEIAGVQGYRVRQGDEALPQPPEEEYAEAREWLRRRITGVRNLTETAMAMFMTGLVSVQYVGLLLWGLYTLQHDQRHALINMTLAGEAMALLMGALALGLVLTLAGYLLFRRGVESRAFVIISHQFYGLTLVGMGYLIGSLSMPTGMVLVAAPLLGLMFFRKRVIAQGLVTSLVVLLGASYAAALGWIPYAPLVPDSAVHFRQANPFWVLSFYYFVLPMLAFMLALLDQVLGMWRQRGRYMQSLSVTDALTHLNNRRNIMSWLEAHMVEARRRGSPLSVVLLDVDYFKAINDGRGHPVGDDVLRRIAAHLSESARAGDLVGRYGGEEFLVVLPDTVLSGALALAERYRARLSELRMTDDNGQPFQVTGSFGVATLDALHDRGAEAMLQRADQALYRAKDRGRDCIETLEEDPAEIPLEPAG